MPQKRSWLGELEGVSFVLRGIKKSEPMGLDPERDHRGNGKRGQAPTAEHQRRR